MDTRGGLVYKVEINSDRQYFMDKRGGLVYKGGCFLVKEVQGCD